jgi:glycosyltransferase involved in cell wall biosynthesis
MTTEIAPAPAEAAEPGPVPQRLLLVLPSTGEFDSRTYRIATAAIARGHSVTVLARWKAGLREREIDPAGYEIIRIRTDPGEALPGRNAARRVVGIRDRSSVADSAGSEAADSPRADGKASDVASDRAEDVRGEVVDPGREDWVDTSAQVPSRRGSVLLRPIRRLAGRMIRQWSILLTIRSHSRRARDIAPPADIIHGMAYMGIPVAHAIAAYQSGHPRVIYDARDIYMDAANLARMRGPVRWVIARAEKRWARRADRVVTVNEPYAEVMASRLGVPKPLIVMNCSYRFTPPDPPEHRFHEHLGLPLSTRVVLYQGGFSLDRGIEQLFDAIRLLDDATLVLMGYGLQEATYRERAASAELRDRVRIMPAVPPAELLSWVASADVVAMPIQPTTLNHRLTTPNKLFEAMAAGVPVVASDLPGMAPTVLETGAGLVVDPTDPSAIAAGCRQILDASPDERAAWRHRALDAAHGTYNWERQVEILFAEYSRLTGHPW